MSFLTRQSALLVCGVGRSLSQLIDEPRSQNAVLLTNFLKDRSSFRFAGRGEPADGLDRANNGFRVVLRVDARFATKSIVEKVAAIVCLENKCTIEFGQLVRLVDLQFEGTAGSLDERPDRKEEAALASYEQRRTSWLQSAMPKWGWAGSIIAPHANIRPLPAQPGSCGL